MLKRGSSLNPKNNNSGAGRRIEEVCEKVRGILENIMVTVVKTNDRNEEQEKLKESKPRKCRYFNRGFCKYREKCRYYHSAVICKEYVKEGCCRKNICSERHPKSCKFWTKTSGGCPRGENCQFLHIESEKYAENDDIEELRVVRANDDPVQDCENCQIDSHTGSALRRHRATSTPNTNDGDVCDLSQDNSGVLQRHRRSQEYGEEMEEKYFISRIGGQWIFTCKTCEEPFISQISVKEHVMAKHGGGWNELFSLSYEYGI